MDVVAVVVQMFVYSCTSLLGEKLILKLTLSSWANDQGELCVQAAFVFLVPRAIG